MYDVYDYVQIIWVYIQIKKKVKNKIDVTKYSEWDNNDVLNWIFSIEDGLFEKNYGDILRKEIKNVKLDENGLIGIDQNYMKELGINTIKHRKLLQDNIKNLIKW